MITHSPHAGGPLFENQIDKYKKSVLQVMLLAAVVAGCSFSVLNFERAQYTLVVLELLVAVVSLWMFFFLKKNKSDQQLYFASLIFVVLFFSVLMYAFTTKMASSNIFIWVFVIPLVSYYLLGVKVGFLLTAIFYVISALLYFTDSPVNTQDVQSMTITSANAIFSASLFWLLAHSYELTNQKAKDKLRKMAVYDHMTGLYNRSLLERIYQDMLTESVGREFELFLVLFDLDHFKKVNDQFGHATGDQVLIEFSSIIKNVFDKAGAAFRMGGEEFLVLYPQTGQNDAHKLAEKVRSKTEQLVVDSVDNHQISVSVGIASCSDGLLEIEDILKIADAKMYQAKSLGRNIVVS